MLEIKDKTKQIEDNTKVYLVFPALETVVSKSLITKGNRVLTLSINSYHKTVDNRLNKNKNIEFILQSMLLNSRGVFEAIVLTDDYYIEKVLTENNINYTIVYPESSNQEEYIGLLEQQGYQKDYVAQFKNYWSEFIKGIQLDKAQGAYTNYIN